MTKSGTATPSCPPWASAAQPSLQLAVCRQPLRRPTPPSTTCATGPGHQWQVGHHGHPSGGEYGIPKDVMFGYPVTCEGGEYKIVQGLDIDAFSQRVHQQDAERTAGRAGRRQAPALTGRRGQAAKLPSCLRGAFGRPFHGRCRPGPDAGSGGIRARRRLRSRGRNSAS